MFKLKSVISSISLPSLTLSISHTRFFEKRTFIMLLFLLGCWRYLRDFEVETIGLKVTPRRCSDEKCNSKLRDTVLDWEVKTICLVWFIMNHWAKWPFFVNGFWVIRRFSLGFQYSYSTVFCWCTVSFMSWIVCINF